MLKVNNKNARRRSFPSVSIVNFEQVNVSWVVVLKKFEKVIGKHPR